MEALEQIKGKVVEGAVYVDGVNRVPDMLLIKFTDGSFLKVITSEWISDIDLYKERENDSEVS